MSFLTKVFFKNQVPHSPRVPFPLEPFRIFSKTCGDIRSLKVHKNENFFGSDFEFCTISLLVMLKY
jgi:hypothetical protein